MPSSFKILALVFKPGLPPHSMKVSRLKTVHWLYLQHRQPVQRPGCTKQKICISIWDVGVCRQWDLFNLSTVYTHIHTGLEGAGLSARYSTYGQVHNSKAQFYIFYFSLSFSCQLNLLSSLPFQLSQSCLSCSPLTLSPLSLYPSLVPLDVSEPPFFLLPSFFLFCCFTFSLSFRLIAACSLCKREVFHLRQIYYKWVCVCVERQRGKMLECACEHKDLFRIFCFYRWQWRLQCHSTDQHYNLPLPVCVWERDHSLSDRTLN